MRVSIQDAEMWPQHQLHENMLETGEMIGEMKMAKQKENKQKAFKRTTWNKTLTCYTCYKCILKKIS